MKKSIGDILYWVFLIILIVVGIWFWYFAPRKYHKILSIGEAPVRCVEWFVESK